MLSIALYAVLLPSGWFGPSNYAECLQSYAVGARSKASSDLAATACMARYAAGAQAIPKKRAQCLLDHLADAKIDEALLQLIDSCAVEFPVPNCAANAYYDGELELCVALPPPPPVAVVLPPQSAVVVAAPAPQPRERPKKPKCEYGSAMSDEEIARCR